MKVTTLLVALAGTPALLVAQQASASSHARAEVTPPASYTVEGRATIDAAFKAARAKNIPEQPMQQRMAEGQAKGASEAQVVASVQKVEARLEASQAAMVRAGRANPQPGEVAAGEQAMERGATDVQIETLAKHTPPDRSLSVALNVLAKLEANGKPVGTALAAVQSKLDARASDDAITSLLGVNTAVGATGAAAGAGGAVSGAVHGVLGVGGKKP